MEKLNSSDNVEGFLKSGKLTAPFLETDYVAGRIECDMNAKGGCGACAKVQSLMNWICSKVKYASGDKEYICNNQFNRSAKEVFESGKTVGCTDYAILFATFARQIGISTTYLHTASVKWLENLKNGEELDKCKGHSFCECFVDGEWILVDPTNKKIIGKYDAEKIKIKYLIGGENEFIPYFRGLDPGKKLGLGGNNKLMKDECKKLL